MGNMRGISLIEVLVAAALLGTTILTVAAMYPLAYHHVDRAGEETGALSQAQQRIEWLRNQSYSSLAAGVATEALAGDYVGFTRTTTIVADTPLDDMKQVTVKVVSPSSREVELVTLIVDPDL
jgi:Tfp pilus assembly protein PilV